MPKYQINLNKRYTFPTELSIQKTNGKILVIAPQTANWIVLESDDHLNVLTFLREGHSIDETLAEFKTKPEIVSYVVTQIEARKLCTKKCKSITDEFRTLHLYLTNKCNLHCPHCYMFSGTPEENELSTEELLRMISDYAKAGGERITLSGGEPTIHPAFDEIVTIAYQQGLKVRVLSNGTLLPPSRIASLADKIDSIQISIDGFSEETNSQVRGNGHFKKALTTIDYLVDAGINTSIAITPPYEVLKDHVEEYISFALALKDKYADKSILIKFSEGLLPGRDVCLSNSINEEYYRLMQRINHRLHGDNYEIISFVRAFKNNALMDNCMFGIFAVASNGDVFFCARISDLKPVANIRNTSFYEIYQESLEAEKATRIDKLKPCSDCELRYLCGGGCRIDDFPQLVNRTSFRDVDYSQIPARKCNEQIKAKFYDLMIKSNQYFYSPL